MLLQSSNADIVFDKESQELRVSSVHKCPGHLESYKIIGAVTVAFFDWTKDDIQPIQVKGDNPQFEEIPTSLSFLHLPASVNIYQHGHSNKQTHKLDNQKDKRISSDETNSFDLQREFPIHITKFREKSNDVEGTSDSAEMRSKDIFYCSSSDNKKTTSVSQTAKSPQNFNLQKDPTELCQVQKTRNTAKDLVANVQMKTKAQVSALASQTVLTGSSKQIKTGGYDTYSHHQSENLPESEETDCQIHIKTEPKSPVAELEHHQNTLLLDQPGIFVKREPETDAGIGSSNPPPSASTCDDNAVNSGEDLSVQESESMFCLKSPESESQTHLKQCTPNKSEQHSEFTDEINEVDSGENSTTEPVLPVWSNSIVLDNADDGIDNPFNLMNSDVQTPDSIQGKSVTSKPAFVKWDDTQTRRKHLMSRKPSCHVCKAQLQSKAELTQHSELHNNNGPNSIKCVVCTKAFSHVWGLRRHAVYHFSNIFHSCPLCNRQVFRIDNFKRHFRKVHPGNETLLRAALSKKITVPKSKLQQLFSKYRTSVSRATTQLRPTSVIKNEKFMSANLSSEFSQKEDNCDNQPPATIQAPTGFRYDQISSERPNTMVQSPILSHHGMGNLESTSSVFVCSDLSQNDERNIGNRETETFMEKPETKDVEYICVTRQNFAHDARKKDMKNFSCSFCQKVIQDVPEFMEHARNHQMQLGPPFSCPVCLKLFRWETNLRQHASNHVLSKLYLCPICKAEISRLDNFKRHITMCHKFYAKVILDNFDSSKYLLSPRGKDSRKSGQKQQTELYPVSECGQTTSIGQHQGAASHQQLFTVSTPSFMKGGLSELSKSFSILDVPAISSRVSQRCDPTCFSSEENKHVQTSFSNSPTSSVGQVLPSLSRPCIKPGLATLSVPLTKFIVPSSEFPSTYQNQSFWAYDRLHCSQSAVQTSSQDGTGTFPVNRSRETGPLLFPETDQTTDTEQSRKHPRTLFLPQNPKRPKYLQCLFCGGRVFDELDLLNHARNHRNSGDKTVCPLCFVEFTQEEMLKEHSDVHIVPNSSFACPDCGAKYTRKDNMLRHFKTCQETAKDITTDAKQWPPNEL